MPEETTLADLRVLDLSSGIAGGYCASIFAEYGADVIAVEPPAGSPLRPLEAWGSLAGGKRSVTLDITSATGERIFRDMVESANLIVQRAGTLESLGLGFGELQAIKRRIILTSISESEDAVAAYVAGLNAFASSAIAAENADSNEVPQHIEIDARECVAAAAALGLSLPESEGGFVQCPFEMSAVEATPAAPPAIGEHNLEIFCDEMGMAPESLARLRAAGVV